MLSSRNLDEDIERSMDYLEDKTGLSVDSATSHPSGRIRTRPKTLDSCALTTHCSIGATGVSF